MKSSFRAYLFPLLVAGLVLTGCSQDNQGIKTDMRGSIETELGAVEKVTVMSTDGQEVALELPVFMKELTEQGQDLEVSTEPLDQGEVRFTLVLYRKDLAPLVVPIGEKASQYGDRTFRGNGAKTFYQWVHKQVGTGILAQEMNNIYLSAEDLSSTKLLQDSERDAVKQLLRSADPELEQGVKQYPLHPYYRMRIHSNEKPLEVTVLTPTLISIPFGRETLTFHVEGALFSQLTSWLPPKEKTDDIYEKLFKANKLRIEKAGRTDVEDHEYDVTTTTKEQGKAHQIVRLIKSATPLPDAPSQPGEKQYVLHFVSSDTKRTIEMYPLTFKLDQSWFSHNNLDHNILKLLDSSRK
ncbi:hypothetical protein [Brevibacillus sp. AY1]|uniref:hypothetical protein n=1 Tax=Brevibacillus sp. AY1 TaxID=2807621 RepID=UPI002454A1B8|nr:hypothetical protein [Brevibacillus sp. AY1]MDH4617176.1 hypothetical protein [Brevibacillus sp. AY1]